MDSSGEMAMHLSRYRKSNLEINEDIDPVIF